MKKAAMFGLLRALKKQSSELFLARRHSLAPQGASGSIKSKRGAMFGLDARIALAIFGALSVISGAALYSAIQQVKVTQLHQEFINIEKAIEAYMLDTGINIPVHTSYNAEPREIFTSSNTGWKGPYLSPKDNASSPTDFFINWPNTVSANSNLFIFYKKIDDSSYCATVEKDCNYLIMLNFIDSDIAKGLDEFVDGEINSTAGKVQYSPHTDTSISSVFYKSIPVI